MRQAFFRTAKPNSCFKRLVNQYNIININYDYNKDVTDEDSIASYRGNWPRAIGDGFSTPLEICEQTGDILFNLQLTDEQITRLPNNDNPNFYFQYEGELNEEGNLLPLPTFMVEDYDLDGVGLGTYHEQVVCVQGI